jgi:hypothetical protein
MVTLKPILILSVKREQTALGSSECPAKEASWRPWVWRSSWRLYVSIESNGGNREDRLKQNEE